MMLDRCQPIKKEEPTQQKQFSAPQQLSKQLQPLMQYSCYLLKKVVCS
jgi:hypothetical protein